MAKNEKATEASLVEKVLDAVSKERRDAHSDLDSCNDDLGIQTRKENAALVPVMRAYNEATRDVAAHARYKDHLSAQAWDTKQRLLQRALDDATSQKDVAVEAAERRLAPLQRRAKIITERCVKLAEEWEGHVRQAKAAGVDLKRFWSPENPVPGKVEEAVVES